ncbi:MAG TPA: DUF4374 domain-containing protein [Niabella sp.]|nr:DUF4374 domain-containing protein [Niabella sp.]
MKQKKLFAAGLITLLFLGACSKDDTPDNTNNEDKPKDGVFVITGRASAFAGSDVIYTANSLDTGTLITTGTGIEQDGSTFNYSVNNGSLFSFKFGQSAAGSVDIYGLDASKKLVKSSSFQTETMTCFANVGDDILTFKNAWQPEEQFTQWFRINAKTKQIVAQGEINAEALVGNGEKAFFTDVKKVNDKVFASFISVQSGLTFRSAYPDSNYVAIYKYPEMTLEKVVRDGRTGSIGAYWYNATDVDEDGNYYAFGTKLTPDLSGKYSTVTPAGIMKIKSGTTEYDKTFFINLTSASGGQYVWRKNYLGKGYFLLSMCPKAYQYPLMYLAGLLGGGVKFAIVNVNDGSFKWVTGAPAATSIQLTTGDYYYTKLDGTGYVGIYSNENNTQVSAVYKFDGASATATMGLKTDGKAAITTINWLPIAD